MTLLYSNLVKYQEIIHIPYERKVIMKCETCKSSIVLCCNKLININVPCMGLYCNEGRQFFKSILEFGHLPVNETKIKKEKINQIMIWSLCNNTSLLISKHTYFRMRDLIFNFLIDCSYICKRYAETPTLPL